MKPEPYYAPPPRELTEDEHVMLRCSAAFGKTPVPLRGASAFALARRLEKMGLGAVEGRGFVATPRGVAAAKKPNDA